MTLSLHRNYSLAFLVCGLLILWFTRTAPIGDFGNYYYGSKLLSEKKFSIEDYQSIHHFNEQIKSYGEHNYFENYTPVPPFSLLFYLPLTVFQPFTAKLVFNLVSLFLFCFSYHRLTKHLKLETPALWFLPLFALYPLYTNLLQGQSYLLICSLMLEGFIAYEKKQTLLSALLFSVTICLKIFTGFILLFFFLRKDFRFLIATGFALIFLIALTYISVEGSVINYYLKEVLPRLAENEILEPYHYSSQGFHTFLLNLFSYDAVQNPEPLLNNMILVMILEAIFLAFIITGLIGLYKKQDHFFQFSISLLGMLLFSKHSASYSLFLILPFFIWLVRSMNFIQLLILGLIFLAVNIPPQVFSSQPLPFQFLRLWLFLLAFVILIQDFKASLNLRYFAAFVFLFFGLSYFSNSTTPAYFHLQNSKGALYSYHHVNDSLILQSCYGENDLREAFHFLGKLADDPALSIKDNQLLYKEALVCGDPGHKLKPKLLNDTAVLFLSDLKQGVGFYKLQILPLLKK